MLVKLIRGLIFGLVLLIYGICLLFKTVVSNKDIVITLLCGFGYLGDLIDISYINMKGRG